jgi:hypothetical protein
VFLLASAVRYSSEVQQPMRTAATLDRHQHAHWAAPFDHDQDRAHSLHPEGQCSVDRARSLLLIVAAEHTADLRTPEPSASAGASSAIDHACKWRDCFSSAVRPMWCQRPGVTQRKTVRPGRLHQHVSVQPQRRRGPPIPSASAARVPTARSRTAATAPRRIRRISASLATPGRESTATKHSCALLPRTLLG